MLFVPTCPMGAGELGGDGIQLLFWSMSHKTQHNPVCQPGSCPMDFFRVLLYVCKPFENVLESNL